MNKDRLEEIKNNITSNEVDSVNLHVADFVWLIEKAERVQELKKRLKIYQKRSWFEDYEKVAKQNKRYRETIEKIKDYNRKALKGNYTENEALLDISLEIRKLEESQ